MPGKMKKAVRGRPRQKKMRVPRGPSNVDVPERASMTEIFASQTLQTNANYSSYNISLAQCPRAQNLGKAYQYFRIKSVTYVLKPLMDTFTSGGVTVPHLYYLIDRTRQFQNGFTLDQLKAAGAKPHRLDEKIIEFHYKPSVLTDTFDNTAGAQTFVQYKLSPWLPCKDIAQVGVWNPSTIDHTGIVWRVEQTNGPIGFNFERRVELEFKKPALSAVPGDLEVPTSIDDPLPTV